MEDPIYKEYTLSSRVDSFISEQLRYPRTLSSLVRGIVDIEQLQKITYLPDDINIEKIDNYACTLGTRCGPADHWMIQKINTFLNDNSYNVVIFQNPCARPNDPWIHKKNMTPYLHHINDEAYFSLHSGHADDLEIIQKVLINGGGPWDMLAIMTELPQSLTGLPKEISFSLLEEFARNMSAFFMYAFDEESYILCYSPNRWPG